MAWWQHRDGIAMTWRRHGDHMATAWRRHCDDMATTRRPHGDDMATTWRRHGDVARTTTTTVRTTMTAMTRTTATIMHETELYRVWCRHRYTYGYGLMMPKRVCHNQISFSYVLSQMGAMLSESGKAKWVCSCAGSIQLELCSINGFETTAVFFWQPMSSHVAKVTTWTNLVNLNSGFFDVSVHKYIPPDNAGNKWFILFLIPALSGDELLLSGARGAEKVFPFYVVSETPSYMSRLCRKPLRGVPQSHCTSGFSVPIGI